MESELKAKWVAALRSGEYQQGRYRLRPFDDAFCCIGVLCDVAEPTGWSKRGGCWNHSASCSTEWIPEEHFFTLTEMNDHENKSFIEIADWIEENL